MDEQRKYAILFAATILAARKLTDPDLKPWPRAAAISDAISKANQILEEIDERWPSKTEPRSESREVMPVEVMPCAIRNCVIASRPQGKGNLMCPYCQANIVFVNISEIQVNATVGGQTWRGIKYVCPTCGRVLSVAIDPVALSDDLVGDIVEQLGTH